MAKVRRVFISSLDDVRDIFSSVSVILNLKVLLSIPSVPSNIILRFTMPGVDHVPPPGAIGFVKAIFISFQIMISALTKQ
jgi:hypothetical protein